MPHGTDMRDASGSPAPTSSLRLPVREVEHLLARLSRYTRFVLLSKWFFGIFALLLMVSLIAWPLLSKNHSGLRISFIGTSQDPTNKAARPVMEHPEFRGTNSDGMPYKLRGKSATQASADLVVIDTVQGQMLRPHQGWVMLLAERGEYQQKAQLLELIGNVSLEDHLARRFTTSRMTLHTQTTDAETDQPVEISTPDGKLLATGFKMRNNGQAFLFGGTGRVTVHLEKMRATK